MKRIAVVGTGKMLVDCLKLLTQAPKAAVLLAIGEATTSAWSESLAEQCRASGIPFLASRRLDTPDVLSRLAEAKLDIVFSINNYRIFTPAVLAIPREGTINFHNGPLPRYGGLHAPSWAIINGETEHGVTWHYVDAGIDTGDIIAQRCLPIGPNETARSLSARCIKLGIESFQQVLPSILDGTAERRPQDRALASYYSRKDTPNHGVVNFQWAYAQVDRFIRGLTFHPMPNPFVRASTTFGGRTFYIDRIAARDGSSTGHPGLVVGTARGPIEVEIGDGVIAITHVSDAKGGDVSPQALADAYGIRVGTRLGT